jgi:Mg-chelatase subunit ChlD
MTARTLLGMLSLALAGLLAAPPAAHAIDPAVARVRFVAGSEPKAGGSAFFVAVPGEVGAVAVTTAHAFSLADLVLAEEVRFELTTPRQRVSVSSRLHAEPGRPFAANGGKLRDDFLIFALDLAPAGVRLLALCSGDDCAKPGQRVRILGVPASGGANEDDVFGHLTRAEADQLEVQLDVPADLRGFGGGPVLRQPQGDVIGILEAQLPGEDGLRLGVAPIDGVRAALAQPLDAGLGRPFARFAERAGVAPPEPGAAPRASRGRAQAGSEAGAETATALDDEASRGPLLGRAGALSTDLRLAINSPADGAIVAAAQDAFVAGRALALLGEFRRFDVMLVIDTSDSTRAASGSDVNENGVVGEDRLLGVFPTTDAGDSVLAAEVAAARRVLTSFDARNTRVGLVTFSGAALPQGTIVIGGRNLPPAETQQPLTSDYRLVARALDHVLARGPEGLTNMTEGVRLAVRELKGFQGSLSKPDPDSEKVVLFFTDGQPTLPFDNSAQQNVRSVLRAAEQARRAKVTIHTFALGPEALEGPVAVVEMARVSRGRFTPVRKPGDLIQVIENVNFANLERLSVRNQTLDRPAAELVQKADGGFGALVPLQPGRNVIEVYAKASDGTEARANISVQAVAGAPTPVTPPELVSLRNQLLEQRLLTLRRDRIETAREHNDELRRELEVSIERERASAEQRAAEQRRELKIEPAREGEPEAAPAPSP